MKFAKLLLCQLLLALPMLSQAQSGRGSWTTFGGDPQRTGWNKTETDLRSESVKHLKLEWSVKLAERTQSSEQPDCAVGPRQRRDAQGRQGSGDGRGRIQQGVRRRWRYGKIFWEKTLSAEGTPQRRDSWLCPNGLTATPVIGPVPRTLEAPRRDSARRSMCWPATASCTPSIW